VLRFYVLSVTVGASASQDTYIAPEKDIRVKKIMVSERSGADLYNVFLKIDIQGDNITRQDIPAWILNQTWNRCPPLEFNLPGGVKLNFTVTNNTASSIDIDIIIAYED